jgi:hypothetical protein
VLHVPFPHVVASKPRVGRPLPRRIALAEQLRELRHGYTRLPASVNASVLLHDSRRELARLRRWLFGIGQPQL